MPRSRRARRTARHRTPCRPAVSLHAAIAHRGSLRLLLRSHVSAWGVPSALAHRAGERRASGLRAAADDAAASGPAAAFAFAIVDPEPPAGVRLSAPADGLGEH